MVQDLTAPDLVIRGISKQFGSVKVLKGIDLTIRSGEFVGLMGPNGAGKSTLIKVLGGLYTPNSGSITFGEKRVSSLAGIPEVGFIHQDLGLIDDLTISENLRLGEEPMRLAGTILDTAAEQRSAVQALSTVGLDIPVVTPVGDLSPGEKTLVAIARAFSRGARLVFVDEATSTLPPKDSTRVIEALEGIVARGATVIMVSHKLNEILHATHRVVLILDGELAADREVEGLDRSGLVELLAQHERAVAEKSETDESRRRPLGDVMLRMEGARAGRAGPFDLEVRAGEVVGITGLPGSGLHDIAYAAHGALNLSGGKRRLAPGIHTAIVPPHRETQGGFNDLSVRDNLTISNLKKWRTPFGVLAISRERADSQALVDSLAVVPGREDAEYGVLSGGNKQKVVFGRALLREAGLYVLCEPTRGVDIQARSDIYELIDELKAKNAGVLVISSDAEDLLAVCDTVSVVSEGRLSAPQPVDQIDEDLMEDIL